MKRVKKNTYKISECDLRKIISESINKYFDQAPDVNNSNAHDIGLGKFGMFKLSPALMSCIYEAAFQMLGYERFAIDGELVMDNSVMDNPWDDAYSILDWAIKNKGLDEKYLGRVSSLYSNMGDDQFKRYAYEIECGKAFWFTKEELREIFKVLPDVLKRELVKDMINAGRSQKVRDMVEQLKELNGGKNLEEFLDIMRSELRGRRERGMSRGISSLREPVRNAIENCYKLNK